jgi:hypothetical protein
MQVEFSRCGEAGAGMDRGVVVGGLMICGSFLLATSLNRSAVKETPPAAPAAPAAEAPIAPMLSAEPADEPKPASCDSSASSTATKPVAGDAPKQGDLPGNGRKACSQ